MIKGSDVSHVSVPHYDGLTLNDIKTFLDDYPDIWKYLPDEVELSKVPRQYICNVIATREYVFFS